MSFPYEPIVREPNQEEILATALLLAQNYGDKFRGMRSEDWVDEARTLRKKVEDVIDVFYATEPKREEVL